jgi:membrane-associated protease RseP (regulator of RpoE activity)
MEIWLLLTLLSALTYYLVKRNVANLTRTPVWLLWLVMMAPMFIWSSWILVHGKERPMPFMLMVAPFLLCPLIYFWLVELGRLSPPTPTENPPHPEPEAPPTRPTAQEEEKSLRDCFPLGIYYLQHIDYRPQAILCRGKLKTVPEVAYQTVKDNVETAFGDRFLVLFQENLQGQPFFALVSNPWSKSQPQTPSEPVFRPCFALTLLLLTLFTTTWMGMRLLEVEPESLTNLNLFWQGLPYSLGLMTILGIHELSHYFAARHYKILTTLPYFIPIPFFLGTFGAFIQMRSPIPHRKALFDVGIAGPLGGFIVTVPLLVLGLSWSEAVPLNAEDSSLLNFQSLNPRFSLLFALLTKIALGNSWGVGEGIHLHPLAVAGYVGLIITALNLMPVGQLDGGHIVHAMYGQKVAMLIGQVTRLLMLVLSLIRPDFLLWAIFLLLMPIADQSALNDVSELDNKRDFLGLLSLLLLITILLPLPKMIGVWLNL